MLPQIPKQPVVIALRNSLAVFVCDSDLSVLSELGEQFARICKETKTGGRHEVIPIKASPGNGKQIAKLDTDALPSAAVSQDIDPAAAGYNPRASFNAVQS